MDFAFGIDDISKLFDVVDLLENKEELVREFAPEVQQFMVKESFFTGPFRIAYQNAFDELIVHLIKRQIIKHFPAFTPEDVLTICDRDFLKMITQDYYFDPQVYKNLQRSEENE